MNQKEEEEEEGEEKKEKAQEEEEEREEKEEDKEEEEEKKRFTKCHLHIFFYTLWKDSGIHMHVCTHIIHCEIKMHNHTGNLLRKRHM